MYTILTADDSASMRQLVSFTLKRAGFSVVAAVDGEDALNKASQGDYQLVLTDQNMPKLDGIGLTRKLRKLDAFRTMPILILTTESGDEMKAAGRAAGATGWLVKPFEPARLVDVVGKLAAQYQAAQRLAAQAQAEADDAERLAENQTENQAEQTS